MKVVIGGGTIGLSLSLALLDSQALFCDDDTAVYKLINLHNDVPICKADYLSIRERTYTPNHRNNGRGKFKRSGR
jgi:hypothetical protein